MKKRIYWVERIKLTFPPPPLGFILGKFMVSEFKRKLRRLERLSPDIEDYVELAFSFNGIPLRLHDFAHFSIRPAQVKEEITHLIKILAGYRSRTILEIGTAHGGTLFLFSRVASPDATIISIDLPSGPFGGGYPKWKIPLYKSFAMCGGKIHPIRRDSHDWTTLSEVKKILGERKIDFLFIDGDHTYEGVKRDFEMYKDLVRTGGVIAFHDICPHPPETGCEVNKFWGSVKRKYKLNIELVKNWKQGWAGIGVLYV